MKLYIFIFSIFCRSLVAECFCDDELRDPVENLKKMPFSTYAGGVLSGLTAEIEVGPYELDKSNFLGGFALALEYIKPESIYSALLLSGVYGKGFSGSYNQKSICFQGGSELLSLEWRIGQAFMQKRLLTAPFVGLSLFNFENQFSETALGLEFGSKFLYLYSADFDFAFELAILSNFFNELSDSHDLDRSLTSMGANFSLPCVWHYGPSKSFHLGLKPYFNALSISPNFYNYGLQLFFGVRL